MNRNDQKFMVEKIRTQYTENGNTKFDKLKALDGKVKRPVNVFAYIFGSIGAIIMGSGMSLIMTDIGTQIGMENTMVSGVVIGVIGMVMAIMNYPIHKHLLNSRRKKYADQIMQLSDEIIFDESISGYQGECKGSV